MWRPVAVLCLCFFCVLALCIQPGLPADWPSPWPEMALSSVNTKTPTQASSGTGVERSPAPTGGEQTSLKSPPAFHPPTKIKAHVEVAALTKAAGIRRDSPAAKASSPSGKYEAIPLDCGCTIQVLVPGSASCLEAYPDLVAAVEQLERAARAHAVDRKPPANLGGRPGPDWEARPYPGSSCGWGWFEKGDAQGRGPGRWERVRRCNGGSCSQQWLWREG